MGNKDAQRELDEVPSFPEELAYLVDWCYSLYGRSGIGFSGVAPLTYATIESWARLNDRQIEPYEVSALLVLDGVLNNPEVGEETPEKPVKQERGWPTRKKKASED